jgi:hypothetical protein
MPRAHLLPHGVATLTATRQPRRCLVRQLCRLCRHMAPLHLLLVASLKPSQVGVACCAVRQCAALLAQVLSALLVRWYQRRTTVVQQHKLNVLNKAAGCQPNTVASIDCAGMQAEGWLLAPCEQQSTVCAHATVLGTCTCAVSHTVWTLKESPRLLLLPLPLLSVCSRHQAHIDRLRPQSPLQHPRPVRRGHVDRPHARHHQA